MAFSYSDKSFDSLFQNSNNNFLAHIPVWIGIANILVTESV